MPRASQRHNHVSHDARSLGQRCAEHACKRANLVADKAATLEKSLASKVSDAEQRMEQPVDNKLRKGGTWLKDK